ncbi:MAG: hypothetical protein BroJett040_17830 [Oligoflexia bacterium]|nr:MAG: hypothetical protein BroJett040_17830 [Oligoflexia bacterium]
MDFKHTFLHVDVSEALKAYSQEQIQHYERYLHAGGQCHIHYRFNQHHCEVQIDVHSSWGHFKATAKGDSFYLAVDKAAEKIGKQFLKMKEKNQNHKKYDRSKQGRLERVNTMLEFDGTPYPYKKPA